MPRRVTMTLPRPSGCPLIHFESVTKRFESPGRAPVLAVDGVDLVVRGGSTTALLGTSGCGKTTSLRLVNRLEQPDAGRILVAGRDVAEVDVVRLRRGMGYVVQSGGLLPHLSVAANVGLLCQLEGWSAERRASRVGALLESVQLEPATFARRFPHELSGGQRQRVGLARALALDPPILLMDEPFGALDPIIRREVRAEFAALQRSLGKTVLLVTHDVREAFELADEVAVMAEGRLLQLAAPEELLARPANGFVESFIAEARRG